MSEPTVTISHYGRATDAVAQLYVMFDALSVLHCTPKIEQAVEDIRAMEDILLRSDEGKMSGTRYDQLMKLRQSVAGVAMKISIIHPYNSVGLSMTDQVHKLRDAVTVFKMTEIKTKGDVVEYKAQAIVIPKFTLGPCSVITFQIKCTRTIASIDVPVSAFFSLRPVEFRHVGGMLDIVIANEGFGTIEVEGLRLVFRDAPSNPPEKSPTE